jgi:nickel/cobalt transporter (NicO) family protein
MYAFLVRVPQSPNRLKEWRAIITDILGYLVGLQGWIRGAIAAQLTDFATTRDWTLLAAMLPLGIGFGAIHAFTPGHGKMLLASYLLGSRLAALRSAAVAGVLALTHVGSAVLIALVGVPLLSKALGSVGRAPALETVSRTLLAVIGFWLVVRALRGTAHRHEERSGVMVGVTAGLVPCPLTLFAMVFAMSHGVPEAGLTFALAMTLGVGFTLVAVALLATFARVQLVTIVARHGASIEKASRVLDGVAGCILVFIATRELLR